MAHLLRHGGTEQLEQDFAAWGAPPPEMLEQLKRADQFELWPENVEPLSLFMRLQTQWRYGPSGKPTGLDYQGVRVALDWMDATVSPELFEDIQVMESATIRILSEA